MKTLILDTYKLGCLNEADLELFKAISSLEEAISKLDDSIVNLRILGKPGIYESLEASKRVLLNELINIGQNSLKLDLIKEKAGV